MKKILFAAVMIIGILTGKGLGSDQPGFTLEVWDKRSEQKIIQLPIQPREVFYLKTLHSLALTPYTHIYEFDEEGQIILSGAIFESGGGGFPESGDGKFSMVDGKFKVEEINRFVGALRFRVSPISRETLIVAGREFPIYRWLSEGTPVEIRAKKERKNR